MSGFMTPILALYHCVECNSWISRQSYSLKPPFQPHPLREQCSSYECCSVYSYPSTKQTAHTSTQLTYDHQFCLNIFSIPVHLYSVSLLYLWKKVLCFSLIHAFYIIHNYYMVNTFPLPNIIIYLLVGIVNEVNSFFSLYVNN